MIQLRRTLKLEHPITGERRVFTTLDAVLGWLDEAVWPLPCIACSGTGYEPVTDDTGGTDSKVHICVACKGKPHHEQVTEEAAVRMGALQTWMDKEDVYGTRIMEGVENFQGECFVLQGHIVRNKSREGRGWVVIGTMTKKGHVDHIDLNSEGAQIIEPDNVLERNPEHGG